MATSNNGLAIFKCGEYSKPSNTGSVQINIRMAVSMAMNKLHLLKCLVNVSLSKEWAIAVLYLMQIF